MTIADRPPGVTWQERRLEGIVVHVLPGSPAEMNLPIIAARLEGLRATFEESLGAGPADRALRIYLTDAEADRQMVSDGVVIPYRADIPVETVERSVLAAWLAVRPSSSREADALLDGLLGYIHSRRAGDQLGEIETAVAEAQAQGEQVDVFSEGALQGKSSYARAATSFVGFLIAQHGAERFTRYIQLSGDRPADDAAEAVYGKPRVVLQQEWLGRLGRPEQRLMGTATLLGRYGASLRPYWMQSALLLVGLVAGVTWFVVCPQIYRPLINDALLHRNEHLALVLVALLFATAMISFLGSLVAGYLSSRLGSRVAQDLRLKAFEHLQHLPLGYYGRTPASGITSHFSPHLETVESALTQTLPRAVSLGLQITICFVLLFVAEWRLALLSLILSPALYAVPRILGPRANKAGHERQRDAGQVAGTVQEQTNTQPVVQAFGLHATFFQRFGQEAGSLAASSFNLAYLSSVLEAITGLSARTFQVLLVAVGSVMIVRGYLTIGALYTFYLYLQYTVEGLMALAALAQPIQQATGALRSVQELLAERRESPDDADAQPLPRLCREIRLDEVTFSYTGEQANLNQATVAFPAGQYVAVVGPSGCGKSTIINLLMRFYDPAAGSVTFDGHDLRHVTRESLREQIGVVFQEPFLLDASVRENIRMGWIDATGREIEDAARAAQIHDFVMGLPQRYDTVIGERGGQLSGGQRQRLAIARALVRRPAVLLLDEATSALDAQTEAAINETLAQLASQCTIISVTHRLSAAARADRICVLDRGRVAAQGTHAELMEQDGLYAAWHRSQAEAAAASNPRTVADRLRRVGLFRDLDLDTLRALARRFVVEEWDADQIVCREGDAADRFYLIERGQLEVVTTGPSGGELLVTVLRDDDHFGEMAFRGDGIRQASIRTTTASVLLALEREHILATLGDIFALPAPERSLLLWLRRQGEASLTEAAAQTGMAEATVQNMLERLADVGFVHALDVNGQVCYRASQPVRAPG